VAISQFAHGRSQLPFSNAEVVISSGGATTGTKTLYFAIQGQNPVGLNLLSDIVGPVTIAAGQRVNISIPVAARLSGEWWQNFIISASTSSTLSSFTQIGKVPGYTSGGSLTSLPASLQFSTDDSLALSTTVANPSALPASPIEGMMRGVTSTGFVYEYNFASLLVADGLSVLSASVGRWLRKGSFSTYISALDAPGGAGRDIDLIDETNVDAPHYPCSGAGISNRFWIQNNTVSAEPRGKRVGATVYFAGEPKSNLFNGLLKVIFRGYVNTTTGILRTVDGSSIPFDGLDQSLLYQSKKTNLVLQDDLQPGEAYVLDIYPDFTPSDLNNQVPDGAAIKVRPFLYSQSGNYSESGGATGDMIYPDNDRGLVVAGSSLSARVLSRSGIVDYFSFQDIGQSTVGSLATNTSGQIIAINGDGVVQKRSLPLSSTERQRAIISTLDGVGFPGSYSANIPVGTGNQVSIVCSYPSAIRANYPDTKIASNNKGVFNPSTCTIYLQKVATGQIRAFSGFMVVAGTSQTFVISSWSSGTIVASIPTPSDPSFGLFAPGNCTITPASGSTDFTSGDYRACFAFGYSNAITAITHNESQGCILTATGTYATMQSRMQYWAEAVADAAALRAVPLGEISPYQSRFCASLGSPYRFDPNSYETDTGRTVLKPDSLSNLDPGRWTFDESTVWLNGTTAPGSGLGSIGNYYLNTATGAISYKVSASVWTTIGNLAPSIAIGVVSTLSADSGATVANSGTAQNVILDFGVPRGLSGTVNKILNGDFRVAQTGASFVGGTGTAFDHLMDGWQGSRGTSGSATITQEVFSLGAVDGDVKNFLRWSQVTAGTIPILRQRIEGVRAFAGQTCTLSFYAKAGANLSLSITLSQNFGAGGSATVTSSAANISVTTTRTRFTATFTLPSVLGKTVIAGSIDTLDVVFSLPTSIFILDIDSVQMELGSVASNFAAIDYTQSLLLANRYLYYLGASAGVGISASVAAGWASTTSQGQAHVNFPVPMRATPTLTTSASGSIVIRSGTNVTSINTINAGLRSCRLAIASSFAAAENGLILYLNSATAFLQFDSRLPLT
jgi:hypothetical protein